MKKRYWAIGITIGAILWAAAINICIQESASYNADIKSGELLLEMKGLDIVDAKFNSPNVFIKVNSFKELAEKADAAGSSTVFKTVSEGYTVVDSDFSYAWNYQPSSTTGIPTGFFLFMAGFLAFIVTMFVAMASMELN